MREIKFRGKSLITDEWVYGFYYNVPDCRKDNLRHIIAYPNNGPGRQTLHEPINLDTLGQYTGLKDIKGIEIYEGDFLIYESFGGKREIIEVWYEDDWAAFNFGNKKLSYIKNTMEVIGNIYENPELLEV
ncbi:YopX family protein [Senegalia massiliensis]|uniref:YopX family protein n=1 Tax=Senegalia massiliensis TaxID=1720316 RepID=UPI001030F9AA|nr:YopX family protein [Senegalia massiliensis]